MKKEVLLSVVVPCYNEEKNIPLIVERFKQVKPEDKAYVNSLMEKSDLLKICAAFPDMRFIIFTNLEDTPTDEYIFDAIPENVLCISAVNAIAHGGKVVPAPYGVPRRMNDNDDRVDHTRAETILCLAHLVPVNNKMEVYYGNDLQTRKCLVDQVLQKR